MHTLDHSGNNGAVALPGTVFDVRGYDHIQIIATTKANITGTIVVQGSFDQVNWADILSTLARPAMTYINGAGEGQVASPNASVAQTCVPTLGYPRIRLTGSITFPNLGTNSKLSINIFPFVRQLP